MQSQTKKGLCLNCKNIIQIPTTQCLTKCDNCNQIMIFLCHLMKADLQPKLKINCQICHSIFTIIMCPKCKGVSGIRNFMCGFSYECPCKYKSTLVACNSCLRVLSLPSTQSYEKSLIRCKACQNQFRYKICTFCKADIYKRGSDESKQFECPNPSCDSKKEIEIFQNPYTDPQTVNNALKVNRQSWLEKQLCKVCLDKEANMINTSCYHLSVCQECSMSVRGQCPICRATGEYKKIFKS